MIPSSMITMVSKSPIRTGGWRYCFVSVSMDLYTDTQRKKRIRARKKRKHGLPPKTR
jgi:hypothetical protein